MNFFCKAHNFIEGDYGAVVEDAFTAKPAEYLVGDHAEQFEVDGCFAVDNGYEVKL